MTKEITFKAKDGSWNELSIRKDSKTIIGELGHKMYFRCCKIERESNYSKSLEEILLEELGNSTHWQRI
jgi:hypothetical protein